MRDIMLGLSAFSLGFLVGVGIMCNVYQAIRKHYVPKLRKATKRNR